MPLTEVAIKNMKPAEKEYKRPDGGSLYLVVRKTGLKIWRFRFRFDGKTLQHTIGHWPDISLKRARELRDDARKLARQGINPNHIRRDAKQANINAGKNTFRIVAMKWWTNDYQVSEETREATLSRLKRYVFPKIGNRPIADISPAELKEVLRAIKAKNTATRIKSNCSQIYVYAIENELTDRNIARDITGITKPKTKNHAAILDTERLGDLMLAIDSMGGEPTTIVAMKLMPLLFPRKTELLSMRWKDIDFDKAEWHRYASKTDVDTISPLPTQAMELILSLEPLTGRYEHVFHSSRTASHHLGRTTLNEALKAIGFHGEATIHGFRATATTLLVESGWDKPYAEAQLAHRTKDSNGTAYDRAVHLENRRAMLQQWADYLDALKKPSNNVFLLKKQTNR